MWLDDDNVRALIRKWESMGAKYTRTGLEVAAHDLEVLIAESTAPLPPPSEGSERCMAYGEKRNGNK